jgi:hypothetical protein
MTDQPDKDHGEESRVLFLVISYVSASNDGHAEAEVLHGLFSTFLKKITNMQIFMQICTFKNVAN